MNGIKTIALIREHNAKAAQALSANDPGRSRQRAESKELSTLGPLFSPPEELFTSSERLTERRLDEPDNRPGDDVRPGSRGSVYPAVLERVERDGALSHYNVLFGGDSYGPIKDYDTALQLAPGIVEYVTGVAR